MTTLTPRDALEVVRKASWANEEDAHCGCEHCEKKREAIAVLTALVERAGEPVAYCCPHDPDSATAFAWPGTKRSAETHTLALYALTTAPGASQ